MATVMTQMKQLVSRTGLLRGCKTLLRGAGEPRLYQVSAVAAPQAELYLPSPVEGEFGAVGLTYEQAYLGAVGEFIERYCARFFRRDALVHASKRELGDEAVGLDEFAIHAPEQYDEPGFPFPRWDPERRIPWVEGHSLTSGKRRLVPACLVYVPFVPEKREDFLCLSVSSGQACHTDRDQALLSGVYEVVERDSFMTAWLRRLPLPRVDYLDDPVIAAIHRRHLDGCHVDFHVFDMTFDVAMPSMLCIAEAISERGPFVAVGGATRLSMREAIVKALMEAAQGLVWARDLMRRKASWRPEPGWANIRDFEDHVRLYCEPEMMEHLRFLLDTPHRRAVTPPGEDLAPAEALARCVRLLADQGLDCIVVDTTTPEIAAAGFFVPKILIPGTVPLTGLHGLQALGSPRLRTVPLKMGYGEQYVREFNLIPHPFP